MLNYSIAQELLNAAISLAHQQDIAVAIAIVDLGGHIVTCGRLDGVSYAANDICRRKAVAACNFQVPTHILFQLAQDEPLMADVLRNDPNIFIFPGGVPIVRSGKCIGGLGVSGGNMQQDRSIAEAAVAAA
jgi:glc operon protein GlcG